MELLLIVEDAEAASASVGLLWFALLLVPLIAFVISQSVTIVGGKELAVLERRWVGRRMPEGRVVAMRDEVGVQAHILGPGLYWLIPFVYAVRKSPMVEIGENEVGLVDAIDGLPIPPSRIFAKVVSGHRLFQDGEAFLANEGE